MDEERERIMDEAGEIVEAEQDRLFLIGLVILAVVCFGVAMAIGHAVGKKSGGADA